MSTGHYFNRSAIGMIIVSAIIFGFVYWFCANAAWSNDDLRYQFAYTESNGTLVKDFDEFHDQIDTLGDIIDSLTVHHKYVNGRDVAHWFVHLFCGILGQKVFAVCNALMYLVLIFLVLKVSGARLRSFASFITASVLLILGLSTRMTPAFQINYIWMFALILGFILLYFRLKDCKRPITIAVASAYAVVAGAAHEGVGIGVGIALIIHWICNLKTYTRSQYALSIGFGLGLIWMCLAPGNFVRAEIMEKVSFVSSICTFIFSVKMFYILIVCVLTNLPRINRGGILISLILSSGIFGRYVFCSTSASELPVHVSSTAKSYLQ